MAQSGRQVQVFPQFFKSKLKAGLLYSHAIYLLSNPFNRVAMITPVSNSDKSSQGAVFFMKHGWAVDGIRAGRKGLDKV